MSIKGMYKVVFIGPFYTGFFINSSSLIDKGYTNIQKSLITHFHQNNEEGWFIENDDKGGVLWDVEFSSVYGGTPMVPPSLIGKNFDCNDKSIMFEGVKFNIIRILLFFHDYGAGTFRVKAEVNLTREFEVKAYREMVERFSAQLCDLLNPIIQDDTTDLKNVLQENEIPIDSYEKISEELKLKSLDYLPIRSCLWYHRIFIFETNKNSPITQEDYNHYKDVLFSSQMEGPRNCSLNEYAQVYPSFNFSLFLYDKNNRPKDIRLNRIVEIAEYYYAATSLLDTILFNAFARFKRRRERPPKIKELEVELESLKSLSDQLELFLLTLKDSIINLSPSSVIMWRNIDKEWYYTPMLETLREKSQLLTTEVNEKLEELTQKRSETLNKFVKIFTLVAIIGPLLEVYSIAQDLNLFEIILSNLPLFLGITLPILGIIVIIIIYYIKKFTKY
ncbi:MAG: hypothetical protein GF317_19855 [Candidatus Lokiarchaeota archaeon]|nr:hypothetical protein [Candidatus Lokiarchaeota archaeon]MBD3201748.1 hypothetical protein [Candidatus Lokiarchaeota archaeon]